MQMCYLVTSPRYGRKGGTSSKAFQAVQEQCFSLWAFVTLQTFYMHKKLYNTLKERKEPHKHNRSSLNLKPED